MNPLDNLYTEEQLTLAITQQKEYLTMPEIKYFSSEHIIKEIHRLGQMETAKPKIE